MLPHSLPVPPLAAPDGHRRFEEALIAGLHGRETGRPVGGCLEEVARSWADRSIRFVGVGADSPSDIRRVASEFGLAPGFVDAVLAGFDGASQAVSGLLPELGFMSIDLSARVKDVCATVRLRAKPMLCPFSGMLALARHSVDNHTFLHRGGGRTCVVLPDRRVEQAAGDRCWYFPEHGLALSSTPGFDGREPLARMAARVVGNSDGFARYLSGPAAEVMVSEDAMSHIGHYVWNIVSGWTPLFGAVAAEEVDTLTSFPGWNVFGGVTALYPEQVGRAGRVLRPCSETELFDTMLERRALSLTLVDRFVTQDAADRIVTWSRGHCREGFGAEVDGLRAASWPLLMVTVRTGNRAWVEQEAGYIQIIGALSARYPRLGVVIDGLNTGMEQAGHSLMSVEEEMRIAAAIMGACSGVRFRNSVGCLPQESVVLAEAVDAFIAPVGAGLAKTRWVANKPGVAFSNRTFMAPGSYDGFLYDGFREGQQPGSVRYVAAEHVTDRHGPFETDAGRRNFSVAWEVIYEMTLDMLDGLGFGPG